MDFAYEIRIHRMRILPVSITSLVSASLLSVRLVLGINGQLVAKYWVLWRCRYRYGMQQVMCQWQYFLFDHIPGLVSWTITSQLNNAAAVSQPEMLSKPLDSGPLSILVVIVK